MSTHYPEHEKLEKVAPESQIISDFLEWLPSQKILLGQYAEYDMMAPAFLSKEKLLAKYFGIDLTRLEAEKRAMLDTLRR